LLLLLLAVAVLRRHPAGGEAARPDGGTARGEVTVARPNARPRRQRAPEPGGPAVEVTPDRTFPETWVVKPQPIEGLKGWSIETNDVGQAYPVAFDFTKDEQLLIRYFTSPTNNPFWKQFDPKTGGLTEAPFNGSYDALTGDARMCARCGTGGVQLWDQGGPRERVTLRSPGTSYAAAFSPDGKMIVTVAVPPSGSNPMEVWFWDAQEGSNLAVCPISVYPGTLAWSPDSRALAGITSNGGIAIALFHAPWSTCDKTISRPAGVNALSWSPDGKYLATVEGGQQVHVIDVAGDRPVTDIPAPKKVRPYVVPAWSPPDGKELAFATEDRKVVVWDLGEKKVTYTFTGHTRPINAVAYLGDGKTLISGSNGGVRFWDLEKNAFRGTLLNLPGQGWLAISPEGYYRCSPGGEAHFVFKVREESNRLREFSPDDFHKLYGWENHPERVQLTGE
jgi:WD40 repeat protein